MCGGAEADRQVLDVFVLRVDDLGQVLTVDLLLENPHLHLRVESLAIQHIAADDLGNGTCES